ncbi:hypothetical protein F4054_10735 [Candidatus Poribacteria bacterium]|nr:hypothetical protein [Candidatus Poribacteria bacterium]MYG07692.1 hypothetical protein [Candidatus Poribacteria bacterium]MYK22720.1 hypothetical protein [Candidatus Poribacteria bacterium]
MRQKSIAFAIKALLCVGAIAVCFIIYTLVSPVAMTEQQTATLKRQSKDAMQSAVATKSTKKSCGCCAERNESSVVSRALHSLKVGDGSAPRIAIVGETSVGKTALVNALFGSQLAAVRLTADTTRAVLRVQFPSNLVIYDTPGIFGDEKLENITRSFIGLRQGCVNILWNVSVHSQMQ